MKPKAIKTAANQAAGERMEAELNRRARAAPKFK
jgi:hypothetical protein